MPSNCTFGAAAECSGGAVYLECDAPPEATFSLASSTEEILPSSARSGYLTASVNGSDHAVVRSLGTLRALAPGICSALGFSPAPAATASLAPWGPLPAEGSPRLLCADWSDWSTCTVAQADVASTAVEDGAVIVSCNGRALPQSHRSSPMCGGAGASGSGSDTVPTWCSSFEPLGVAALPALAELHVDVSWPPRRWGEGIASNGSSFGGIVVPGGSRLSSTAGVIWIAIAPDDSLPASGLVNVEG